jgi:hypothetical protein
VSLFSFINFFTGFSSLPETRIGQTQQSRRYRVGEEDDFIEWEERTFTDTTEYHKFNSDAWAIVGATFSPNPPNRYNVAPYFPVRTPAVPSGGVNNWSMREDNRTIGSYVLTRTYEFKSVTQVDASPPPVLGSVNFSVPQNTNITSFPFNLQLQAASSERIRYRIDTYIGGALQTGAWTTSTGNVVTISVNTSNLAAGATINGVAYHKYVVVYAQSTRTQQTGETYNGPISSRIYAQRAPVLGPVTWSRNSEAITSWPTSVTITGNAGNTIEYSIYGLNSQGQWDLTSTGTTSSGSSVSVNTNILAAGSASTLGVTAHKAAWIFARQRVTIDGVDYAGEFNTQGSRIFVQAVPTVSAPTVNGGTTDELSEWGGNYPTTVTVTGTGVNHTIRYRSSVTEWNGFRRPTDLVLVSDGSNQNNPTLSISQPPTQWDIRSTSACPRGASYRSVRVAAWRSTTLDGIVYESPTVFRWFTRRTACFITANPGW